MKRTFVLGVDSLDPHILWKYKPILPNFTKLMEHSPTFLSKSVFPVDTIPAWASIYTGLRPGNHGLLYVYDIFDPTMGDLQKLSIDYVKGRSFKNQNRLFHSKHGPVSTPIDVHSPSELQTEARIM